MSLHPRQRPVLHRGVGAADPVWFERAFAAHGWTGGWRNGVYDWHHYHRNTHEVLGCYAGSARVQFGGASGEIVQLDAGDVVIIPAGLAHCRISQTADFAVVGAYPDGRTPQMRRGEGDAGVDLPRPVCDPVLGRGAGFAV